MKKLLLAILIFTALTACSGNAAEGEITSSEWVLLSMPGYETLPATPTMAFDSEVGRLTGSSGCNHYSTAYEITGDRLKLDAAIASTMMGCPEPQMSLEQAFLSQLATVNTFKLSGDRLILHVEGGEMVFQAAE